MFFSFRDPGFPRYERKCLQLGQSFSRTQLTTSRFARNHGLGRRLYKSVADGQLQNARTQLHEQSIFTTNNNMKPTSFLPLLPIASSLVTPHEETNPWQPGEPRWLLWNFYYTGNGEQDDALFFNLTSDPASFETPVSAECEIFRTWHYWQPCSMLIAGSADLNQGVWVMPLPTTSAINIQIRHSFVHKSDNIHTIYNMVS